MMDSALTPGNYRVYAGAGIGALQGWYNRATGLWESTGWWNSANALEAVIDFSLRTKTTTYQGIISTTFEKNKKGNFLNKYYDDEGWWALTWIKAYDLTGDKRYLSMAETIFADTQGGWDMMCGGGIWWSKRRDYKNAIANELFLTVAARLYQRTSNRSYLHWAEQEWTWFSKSGMINDQNLVNDGLNSVCQNNGQTTWTYNQGVILGGLKLIRKPVI
jgi:predicted alpha-1,6-mannanase (GH76 family)